MQAWKWKVLWLLTQELWSSRVMLEELKAGQRC